MAGLTPEAFAYEVTYLHLRIHNFLDMREFTLAHREEEALTILKAAYPEYLI